MALGHPLHWICRPAQAQRRRAWPQAGNRLRAGWRLRLTRPTNDIGPTLCTGFVGPRKRSAAGHGHRQGTVFAPGGGYALSGLQTKHSANRGISRVAAFRLTRATGLGPPLHWICRPAQAQRRRAWSPRWHRLRAGWRLRLTRPTNDIGPTLCTGFVGPRKRSAAANSA